MVKRSIEQVRLHNTHHGQPFLAFSMTRRHQGIFAWWIGHQAEKRRTNKPTVRARMRMRKRDPESACQSFGCKTFLRIRLPCLFVFI